MATDLYARDTAAIGTLQKLRFFPQTAVGGAGCYLRGSDGTALLDLSASWGAASLGYSHPAIVEAVSRAVRDQAGASVLSGTNAAIVELAERLLRITPGEGARKVWFGHSGSDANETVYRAVVRATGRRRIIAFSGAYHGGTTGSMMISGHPSQAHAERSSDLVLLPYPCRYHDTVTAESVLEIFDHMIATSVPPHEIAAIFIEPIQSDGGLIVPPEGFLAALARRCRAHGILIVSDEVKIGLARTGKLHGFVHEGFTPDIAVFGKGLGGGLPISAIVGPADVLDAGTAFAMQTLHGNPVCAAAALAVLDTIEREDLAGRSASQGADLMAALRGLSEKHPIIGDIRGRGLAIGVELVDDRNKKTPATRAAARLLYRCHELGLVAYYVGGNANVIEFTPPLILGPAEIAEATAILDQALSDLAAGRLDTIDMRDFAGW